MRKLLHFSPLLLSLILGISQGGPLMAQDETMATDNEPSASPEAVEKKGLLDVTLTTIDGEEFDLSTYKGKVIVVVNTASKCGFTSQYKKLEKIYKEHHEQGLVVLGFPCNQFGEQEPAKNEDVAEFCKNRFDVTFDLFAKSDVNGDERNDLYKSLCGLDLQPKGKGDVSWNFEKFIIDRSGQPVGRFSSRVSPTDDEFVTVLKQELAKATPVVEAQVVSEK